MNTVSNISNISNIPFNYIPEEIVNTHVSEADEKIVALKERLQKTHDALLAEKQNQSEMKAFSWKSRATEVSTVLKLKELEKIYQTTKTDVEAKIAAIEYDVKNYRGMKEAQDTLKRLDEEMEKMVSEYEANRLALSKRGQGLYVLGPNYIF